MIKLPVSAHPMADESLLGFVARAADLNGHPDMAHVLRLARFDNWRARYLANGVAVDIAELSSFFGCQAGALQGRFHWPVQAEGTDRPFVDFFGSPIRPHFREPRFRRVSPLSLSAKPYHRASWLLRPLTYCPESGGKLISICPNPQCGRPLGWDRTVGVDFCEHCLDEDAEPTTDLKNSCCQTIEGDELVAYRQVAALVGIGGADFVAPRNLEHLKGWELFDFIVMIAAFLCYPIKDRRRFAGRNMFTLVNWHRNFMAAAAAVFDWPNGLRTIVDSMRQYAHLRTGFYGRSKELGPLAECGRIYGALPKASAEVDRALRSPGLGYETLHRGARISQSESMISYRTAVSKHRVSGTFLAALVKTREISMSRVQIAKHAPVGFNEAELVEIWSSRKELLPLNRLMLITGFPMFVIEGLAEAGLIELAKGTVTLGRGPSIHPTEIARIEDAFRQKAYSLAQKGSVPLLTAVRRAGVGGDKLLLAIKACLSRDLRYSLSLGKAPTISRICVLTGDVSNRFSTIYPETHDFKEMSSRDVSIYLEVPQDDVSGLLRAGVLRNARASQTRMIDGDSIRDFAENYLSTQSAAHRLHLPVRSVPEFLKAKNLVPFVMFRSAQKTDAFVWRKSEIDQILVQRPA